MKPQLLLLFLFVTLHAYSQADLQKYKKGFYKTYQEYLNNEPSYTPDFEVELLQATKKDPTIIAAKVRISGDGITKKQLRRTWGFSDGSSVYVTDYFDFNVHFWKLQCDGPNPYLFYKQKNLLIAGPGIIPLITLAATAAVPASHEIMLVMKSGKVKYAGKGNIKKVVADNKAILADLKKNNIYTDADKLKYIRWYNGVPEPDK